MNYNKNLLILPFFFFFPPLTALRTSIFINGITVYNEDKALKIKTSSPGSANGNGHEIVNIELSILGEKHLEERVLFLISLDL